MIEINESNIDTIKSQTTLVEFWAPWCQPCKRMMPIVESIESDYANMTFAKVNIDEMQTATVNYNVTSVPTIIILKDGVEISRKIGMSAKKDLVEFIEKAIS